MSVRKLHPQPFLTPTCVMLFGLASLIACTGEREGTPESAVQRAVDAARAEDAAAFKTYIETAVIPPADGIVLANSLGDAISVGDARVIEDAAVVQVGVRPQGLDTTLSLGLRLQQNGTYWKVVEVENARPFARALLMARRERLELENARVEGQLRRAIQVGEVERTVTFRDVPQPEQTYRYAHVRLRVPVYNARKTEVRHAEVEVLVTDSSGTEYRYRLTTPGPTPHEAATPAALDTVFGVLTGYPTDFEYGEEVEAIRTWKAVSARPLMAVFSTSQGTDTLRAYQDWDDYLRRRPR